MNWRVVLLVFAAVVYGIAIAAPTPFRSADSGWATLFGMRGGLALWGGSRPDRRNRGDRSRGLPGGGRQPRR